MLQVTGGATEGRNNHNGPDAGQREILRDVASHDHGLQPTVMKYYNPFVVP